MNTVVACPMIPELKVLAKVSRPNQSASRPVTCRGSKLSTWNRAINVTISSCWDQGRDKFLTITRGGGSCELTWPKSQHRISPLTSLTSPLSVGTLQPRWEGTVASSGQNGSRPTLETVAARAGVSKSLVSLVLRNSPKVSPASREAVMRAVAELGYRPNAAARFLAERRSRTVGVLLNDIRQPWFADMLDGLTPELHAAGKHILLGDGRIDRMLDETLSWSFVDLGVDGLVLAGSNPPSAALIHVASKIPGVAGPGRPGPTPLSAAISDVASKIPTVAVGGRGLDLDLPHVDVLANDNHLGGTLAVRHLIEFGHTRIAHISGLPSVAGRLRMQAYEDTMHAAGLGGNVLIEAGDMSEEGGYRATVRLMSRPDHPTAIFAANDLTCVGALSAATALGVQVPGELSLVGFDNSIFARLRALWLTSVDGTAHAMGQQAARILLARIERPDAPGQTRLMPPRLEVRGSSGPAPSTPSLPT